MKTCTKCLADKPLESFGRHAITPDGLRYWCRDCARAIGAEYRAANKPGIAVAGARYRRQNGARIKLGGKLYRLRNADALRAKQREKDARTSDQRKVRAAAYRASNRDKVRAMTADWMRRHPERSRVYSETRRALKAQSGGRFTARDVSNLFVLQQGKCPPCRASLDDGFEVDHIVALVNGGSNGRLNLQLLCQACNRSKHARDPVEFMQSRGFLL